jgi:hypothetical protein
MEKEYYYNNSSTINCSKYLRERIKRINNLLPEPYMERPRKKYNQSDTLDLGIQLLELLYNVEDPYKQEAIETIGRIEIEKLVEVKVENDGSTCKIILVRPKKVLDKDEG